MKPYIALIKARMSVLFQYRAAAFAGLATQVFWGIVKGMILTAFYTYATALQPITLVQAITFIWLGQGLLQLLPWNIDKDLEANVKNGNVAYELIRPIDLYWHWFCRSLSMRLVPTLLRSVPLFLIAFFFFEFPLPPTMSAASYFVTSVLFSALLSAAMTTIVLITLFWTISGEGIQRLLPHFSVLFSGLVVPLLFFPVWMQPFLNVQPFRGIIDIPCRFYTGLIGADEAFYFLGFQILWTIAFILVGKALIKKATKQFVIQGG